MNLMQVEPPAVTMSFSAAEVVQRLLAKSKVRYRIRSHARVTRIGDTTTDWHFEFEAWAEKGKHVMTASDKEVRDVLGLPVRVPWGRFEVSSKSSMFTSRTTLTFTIRHHLWEMHKAEAEVHRR